MDTPERTSAPRYTARRHVRNCIDCGRPLTEREQYLGDACLPCEREYEQDAYSDESYPRVA